MKKTIAICALLVLPLFLNSCASGYKKINPSGITYVTQSNENNVLLEYRYDVLKKKYKKKQAKNNLEVVAVKITNNSDRDLVFGKNYNFSYQNGSGVDIVETEELFKTVKQSPASYLWFLLLSPVQLYTGTTTNSNGYSNQPQPTNSFPIGLILGPGIAAGNMIGAGAANSNFKKELQTYDLHGVTIRKGTSSYGIIGVRADHYDGLKIALK